MLYSTLYSTYAQELLNGMRRILKLLAFLLILLQFISHQLHYPNYKKSNIDDMGIFFCTNDNLTNRPSIKRNTMVLN